MARVGVAITKRVVFRDSTQEFSNVYHYTYVGLNPSAGLAESIVDNIVPIDKGFHGSGVSYMRAKVWEADGSPEQNQMIFQKNLTGTGSLGSGVGIDKERAVLIQWPAGFDSRGKPVFLRKWYHICAASIAAVTISTGIEDQSTGFTTANRTAIAGLASGLAELSVNAQSMTLCSASGRVWQGAAQCHPYFEHHQLGDQWRQ